jgi:hypothetical protein
MPSVPTQTSIEKWLLAHGYSKTSTTPLEYTKADVVFTLSRYAITAARDATGPMPAAALAALRIAAGAHIPIALWKY